MNLLAYLLGQTLQAGRFRWRQVGFLLVGLLLGSCQTAEPVTPRSFGLVIPIYNGAGLEAALTTLNPHMRPNDRFMVVSGNTSGEIDVTWINRAAHELRAVYPDTAIYAATSGLGNIGAATREVTTLIEAIVYIYEPNFPNQPEFSWDFETTLARFGEAGAEIQQNGFKAVGKPTGRPLLQISLQSYSWNYGRLADTVDEMFVQTQTYCKESPAAFAEALDALKAQYRGRAETRWIPQITISPAPDAPNGTSVEQAQACLEEAKERGISGAVLWWSPYFVDRAVAFITALNADAEL